MAIEKDPSLLLNDLAYGTEWRREKAAKDARHFLGRDVARIVVQLAKIAMTDESPESREAAVKALGQVAGLMEPVAEALACAANADRRSYIRRCANVNIEQFGAFADIIKEEAREFGMR